MSSLDEAILDSVMRPALSFSLLAFVVILESMFEQHA